ncbi:SCO4651 family lipoprotein [Streptacidiphilus sp. PAMC 29251]
MTGVPIRRALAGSTLAGALALTGCASTGTTATGAGGSASASGSASGSATTTATATGPATPAGDSADTAALQAAADATRAAGSAKLTLDETVRSSGNSISVHGTGVTQLGAGGNGEFTLSTGGQTVQMRVLNKVVYEMLPAAARSKATGGKPWLKIDVAKAASVSGTVAAPDASQSLDYLKDAKNVTKVGTETVDGASTTHYRFQATLPQSAAGMAGVTIPSSIPVDVWVDAQQHIREEKIELDLSASATNSASTSAGTRTASTTTELHLSDFGAKVQVTAPPAAQTADLTGAAASALATPKS